MLLKSSPLSILLKWQKGTKAIKEESIIAIQTSVATEKEAANWGEG